MSEYGKPGHAERVPGGRCPLMWAQSLYIIGKLLHEVIGVWGKVIRKGEKKKRIRKKKEK
jgi:hypothetical protein